MRTHHPDNERIKREYFSFLKDARRQSEATVDAVAQALARFEADTKYRDFKHFNRAQAKAFKQHLTAQDSKVTGAKLSKSTLLATLAHLKRFFQWLAMQPGYRSKVDYTDAEYFSLSDKDARVATARRPPRAPTLEQVKRVIQSMPTASDMDRRDRALMAFALLTGARDSAIATMQLGLVDLEANSVFQDARVVKTKFSKSFTTFFFPVGDEVRSILGDWVIYLRNDCKFTPTDPLFPATRLELDSNLQFKAQGLLRTGWSTSGPVREIFKRAFAQAGLPYFNPHSLRQTLAQLGERLCRTPEEFKAWSQNLGHEGVLTTFVSYGSVAVSRQSEIMHSLQGPLTADRSHATEEIAEALLQAMWRRGIDVSASTEPDRSCHVDNRRLLERR